MNRKKSSLSALGKTWQALHIEERKLYKFIQDFQISDLLARILIGRNITEDTIESFLRPKIKHLLPDPFHMKDMEKACKRITDAILNCQKIMIFGDYDVDGATSSALLLRLLTELKVDVAAYIPDRIKEGYGPNIPIFQKFKDDGVNLVITVDCGITAFDAMNHADQIGLDVIILDHHLSDITLPKAYASVNPNRIDETSQYKYLAAVGVSFLCAVGIIKILKSQNYFQNIKEPDLLSLLDLVALGTVCDMMPLIGLNRAYVMQGLKIMAKQQNIGLKILAEIARIDSLPNTYHLGFVVGPRINAGGRVGKSYLGAHLLSTLDEELAQQYSLELETYNDERKLIEQQVLEEAMAIAEAQLSKNMIFVIGKNWHNGVIGIVAGRLKERYNKPIIVISTEGEIGKASCRSVRGIDIGRKIVEAKNRAILIAGGGHAMAAGFTVHTSKIDELIDFFDTNLTAETAALDANNIAYFDAEISPGGVTLDLAQEIATLEPYGAGNHEPIFKINNLYVLKANIIHNKHISCLLSASRYSYKAKSLKAICFNACGTEIEDILLSQKPLNMSIIANVKINNWQGVLTPQVYIHDIIVDL